MAPTTQNVAAQDFADDFEVIKQTAEVATQEDNGALTAEVARLHAVLSNLKNRTAAESHAHALSVGELSSKFKKLADASSSEFQKAGVTVQELRQLLDSLTKNTDLRSQTHDRRVRTLEWCFDDIEAGLSAANGSIATVKKQVQQETVDRKAEMNAIQTSVDAGEMMARDNSVRIDRLVIKYLPSVEAQLHNVKEQNTQERAVLDSKLTDMYNKLDIVAVDLSDVRRIASEATLRCHLAEKALPNVKSDIYMTMAVELDSVEEAARKDRQSTVAHIERLNEANEISKSHMSLLDRRVTWTEQLGEHLTHTVVPELVDRVNKQEEILDRNRVEMALSAERETALIDRIVSLEETSTRCAAENSALVRRLKLMEDTVRDLVNEVRKPVQYYEEQVIDKELVVPQILDRCLQKHHAKVLPQALRGEIERREQRGRVPSSRELNAEIMRRQIRAEVMHRRAVRPVVVMPTKPIVSAAALQAEIRRRSVESEEMSNIPLESATYLPKISPSALQAEILRRSVKAEIARRRETTNSMVPSAPTETTRVGTINLTCKTIMGDVSVSLCVPTFVSIRYVKQLIYFKTDCTIHPRDQHLVYAGKVLSDCWKVGGGFFQQTEAMDPEGFQGIKNNGTVLVVVKKN